MKNITRKLTPAILLISAALAYENSLAGLRFQKHVPELNIQEAPLVAEEQRDAIIFAPNGLTCALPTQDGYCTVPLKWLTTRDHKASMWRIEDGKQTRVAYAFDGAINAFLRLNQTPVFEIHDGPDYSDRLMDQVQLNAVWDPNWAQGSMQADNDGTCQIYTDMSSCDLSLSWSSVNVKTASVWQRKSSGMTPIVDSAKEGSVSVKAYDFPVVYELREGTTEDGRLLASSMTQGYRVKAEGKLTIPDGNSCYIGSANAVCDLRVKWESNDIARLWIREAPLSSIRVNGQYLVKVGQAGLTVDLRAGGTAQGQILDRIALSSILDPNINGSIDGLGVCDIPYADQSCLITAVFETKASNATVWTDDGEIVAQGQSGEFLATATEYGTAYLLKEGSSPDNPILDTYIARGNKLSYTGNVTQDGPTECLVPYQRGYCVLSLTYTASDNASLWYGLDKTVAGGGKPSGSVSVSVYNHDGSSESINSYDLRIHGPSSPRITDPLLSRFNLLAKRPTHTGSVLPASTPSCNMIYSKNDCEISLNIASTSTLVSLWRTDSNQKVWQGRTSTIRLTVPAGEGQYVLREGSHELNDVLSSITLSAKRPDYFMRLTTPSGESCVSPVYAGGCSIGITSHTNTTGRLYYRDITTNPDAAWVVLTNSISNTTSNLTISSITQDREYEIEARQFNSPYEPLDRIKVKGLLNPPHTLSLTSGVPGENEGYPCATFFNSQSCTATHLIAWETGAPSVTLSWSRDDGQTFFSRTSGINSKNSNASRTYLAGQPHSFYLYEGSVVPTSEQDANNAGQRLLGKFKLPPVKVLPADRTPVTFNAESISCNIVYKDAGSCTSTIGVTMSEMGFSHQARPFYYIRRVDGSYTSVRANSVTYNYTLTIQENEKDVIYELRVMTGATPSDTDPVVDTIIMNHGYQAFSGRVHVSRMNGESSSSKSPDTFLRTVSPYYFQRALIGSNFNSFADVSDDCLVHIDKDVCTVLIEASLTSSSAGASIFVDGNFIGGFTHYVASPNWETLQLTLGAHTIELREGITESAKNNRLLDSFEINVRRPTYNGDITELSILPNIEYHGASTEVLLPIKSNTSGYLYSTSSNRLVCSVSTWYTAEIFSSYGSANCRDTIGAGTHSYELRTHQDASDARNKVLDTYSFTLKHDEQSAEVFPNKSYPQYLNTCEITYTYEYCFIYFDYKTAYSNSSGSSALSICALNESNGSISKRSSQTLSTALKSSSTPVFKDDALLLLIDGPSCPSSLSDTSLPELARWEINPTPPNPVIISELAGRSGSIVYRSETDSDTWLCQRRFENDICYITFSGRLAVANDPGQNQKAYLALYSANNYMSTTGTVVNMSSTSQLSPSEIERDFHVVVCNKTGTTASTCPKTVESVHKTITLKTFLPVYTGSIETPDGNYCQSVYNSKSCDIRLKIVTDSGHVTVHRDGTQVSSVTTKSVDQLFSIPTKEKGATTLFEIRDGSSGNGRVLATKVVTAEDYDTSRFQFVHQSSPLHKDSLDKYCYVSAYVASERSNTCTFDVSYKSDGTTKYLKVNTASAGKTGVFELSGDGKITASLTATTAAYSYNVSPQPIRYSATVYSDPELTQPMDILYIYQRNTIIGEKLFTGFSALTAARSNAYLSATGGGCGYGCVTTYSIQGSYLMRVHNTSFSADDLVLSLPSGCHTEATRKSNSTLCNAIDYARTTLSVPAGTSKTGTVAFGSADWNVMRVFYRVNNIGIAEHLNDPVIAIGGVTRPLIIDANWHYVDIPHTESGQIQISATNIGTVNQSTTIDLFTEHYPLP